MTDRGPSRRLFDLWARVYDNPLAQRALYRPLQDAVVRGLAVQRPGRVIDVGCGTGLLAARIAEELGVDTIGCDYSAGMLEQAVRNSALPSWVQGDAMALPLASGSVDAVVCTASFHWYPDQAAALREFARVLSPVGRAYVALVNPPSELVSRMAGRWSRAVGEPFTWPTPRNMRALVEQAGLRVLTQRRVLRLPMSRLLPPVLTVAELTNP